MLTKINYNNKTFFQDAEEIPKENKVTADDMNEIKRAVNNNADELNTANVNVDNLKKKMNVIVQPALNYKDNVAIVSDLQNIKDAKNGDIYTVTDEGKNYIWNGNEWIEYSKSTDGVYVRTDEYNLYAKVGCSSTEPKNEEKIWFRHGKNLFDEDWIQGQIDDSTGEDLTSTRCLKSDFIEVNGNTDYTFSITHKKDVTAFFRAYEYNENREFIKCTSFPNINGNQRAEDTLKTDTSTKYIRFKIGSTDWNDNILENVEQAMIEQNTVATEYEKYVEDGIFIKDIQDYRPFSGKNFEEQNLIKEVTALKGSINLNRSRFIKMGNIVMLSIYLNINESETIGANEDILQIPNKYVKNVGDFIADVCSIITNKSPNVNTGRILIQNDGTITVQHSLDNTGINAINFTITYII